MNTVIDTGKSQLLHYPNFIDDLSITEELMELPLIERPEIRVFGKVCRQQRNVGFFAKPGTSGYRYSGQTTPVIDINNHKTVKKILQKINNYCKELDENFEKYNGVLINLYENGERYIGKHSDDESGLAPQGVTSIAFGATRTFRIRDKKTGKIIKDIEHKPGDLLIMKGEFQKEFTHEIPVQKKIKDARISLTFRLHKKLKLSI